MSDELTDQNHDDPNAAAEGTPPPLWLSYLQLLRLPAVFSAIADVAAGFVFIQGMLAPAATFATLAAASTCLYLAGMALNDVYDVETDRRERPQRPLPSGRIPVEWARLLGFLLLGAGIAFGWLAGYVTSDYAAMPWRAGATATVLAVCVLLYDSWAKETWLGPVVMGLCRMLNLLLGMSAAGFGADQLLVAGGMGVYIMGVTIFARDEAGESNPLTLGLGTIVMIAGIVLVGIFPFVTTAELMFDKFYWWLLLGILVLTNVRRCLATLLDPNPQAVQFAVQQALMSIIFYDATIAMTRSETVIVSGFQLPIHALAILALLLPAWLLGRWVYST